MMRDILIGIDAGTSVIKSVAFDLQGKQIASASVPNKYDITAGGSAEQDMALTWMSTIATLKALADRVENLAKRTVAISVTGQGDGTWLIDKAGEPLGKGWLWLDARAGDLVAGMRGSDTDIERYRLTGSGLAACQQGSQLRWMLDQKSSLLERATTAFHCKDWLYLQLTGVRAVDPSEANFTFGDFRSRTYSDTVIEALGLTSLKHLLPEIVDGSTSHHLLSPSAASQTGLLEGTPVILGYVDVICTSLGAGLYDPEQETGCTIIGSTGMHMRLAKTADDVVLNSDLTGYTMCMPIPGVYAQMQSNMAATLNIDWILGIAADVMRSQGVELEKTALIALSERWLEASKPLSMIYHPYISDAGERGPFVDANARASFLGVSTRSNFADMVRSVYDGLALASRDCYSAMGPLPATVRLSGGAARSPSLRKILGAALGASIQTSEREEAGAAGTAMIAAVSLGHYADMAACVKEWVMPYQRPAESVDQDLAEIYSKAFPAYQHSRQVLGPVWQTMATHEDKTQ